MSRNSLGIALVSLALAFSTHRTSAEEITFLAPFDKILTAVEPVFMVTTDLTGDGILDVLTCGEGLALLVGAGDFTFEERTISTRVMSEVVVGDVNNDGIDDLLFVSDETNTVEMLLGLGKGFFEPANLVSNNARATLNLADFNSDGALDIVFGDFVDDTQRSQRLSVLLGNGDGSFQPSVQYIVSGRPNSIAVADINLDGAIDILCADGLTFGGAADQVSILYGNNDGDFQPTQSFDIGINPISVTTGDFNGDGVVDIAAGTGGNNVSVLIGDDSGNFELTLHTFWRLDAADSIMTGDFTGDGIVDIAVSLSNNSLIGVMQGLGDGTFELFRDLQAISDVEYAATGDFNGDGSLDFVCGNNDGEFKVIPSNGDGTFEIGPSIETGDAPVAIAVADLNSDGIVDIATANQFSDDVGVLIGIGNGEYEPAAFYPVGENEPVAIQIEDLNADGILDITVANTASVSVLLGMGDGIFSTPDVYPGLGFLTDLIFADINSDSILDIVTSSDTGLIFHLLGNGDGTFAEVQFFFGGDEPLTITKSDFNQDGNIDLITGNDAGLGFSVHLGNGDGTFGAAIDTFIGERCTDAFAHDFNADGIPDLAFASFVPGGFSTMIGVGDGTFLEPTHIQTGSGISISPADFNGDGILDILLSGNTADILFVYQGNEEGIVDTPQALCLGGFPVQVLATDVNGDGLDDAITANVISDDITVLLNQNGNEVLLGDVNLDGTVNLLDVDPFVDLLTSSTFQVEADINCDGAVNLLDVGPFVGILGG